MKENIETKDVQRTEYLGKNGLDMLWAKVKENTHNQVEVERNRAVAKENSITNSLSEFVSKTATDAQSLKSELSVSNSLHIIDGSNTDSHTTITCDGISNADNNANHVYATDGSLADLTQYAKKSEISTGGNVDDVQVNGVSVVENKIANIKPATKESLGVVKVGDGLNVTDGTISAGNYIPYESIADDDNINYKTYVMKHNEGILFDSASGNVSIKDGEVVAKDANHQIAVTPTFIWLLGPDDYGEGDSSLLIELNKNGLRLRHGDNNHVLTSYGSTIDITQYVKKTELLTVPTKTSELQNDSEFITKSVYDEKIAALEARIAALEAKHTETA